MLIKLRSQLRCALLSTSRMNPSTTQPERLKSIQTIRNRTLQTFPPLLHMCAHYGRCCRRCHTGVRAVATVSPDCYSHAFPQRTAYPRPSGLKGLEPRLLQVFFLLVSEIF